MNYLIIGLFIMSSASSWATDFNDGIGYSDNIDDSIKADHNVEFLTVKAQSRAGSGNSDMEQEISSKIGNIEFGIGSKLKNVTIINLSNNEGAIATSGY